MLGVRLPRSGPVLIARTYFTTETRRKVQECEKTKLQADPKPMDVTLFQLARRVKQKVNLHIIAARKLAGVGLESAVNEPIPVRRHHRRTLALQNYTGGWLRLIKLNALRSQHGARLLNTDVIRKIILQGALLSL